VNKIILAPFQYVACPRLDLSLPDLSQLPGPAIFAVAMISYYLIISGIVFDIIRSPPPWGARRDELGNIVKQKKKKKKKKRKGHKESQLVFLFY
jgi:hypothetical protein